MGGKPSLGRMMKRICWWLVDVLSRMLDADERQAVRGDLAESGESVVRVIRDVLDLIVRRQVGLWAGWQPWLALLGIACLAGVPLSRIAFRLNVDLGQQLMAYYRYGVHFGTLLPPPARYCVLAVPRGGAGCLVMDVRIRLGLAFRPNRVAHVVRFLPHGLGFYVGKIRNIRQSYRAGPATSAPFDSRHTTAQPCNFLVLALSYLGSVSGSTAEGATVACHICPCVGHHHFHDTYNVDERMV
jgi:hypothetical protein